MIGKDGKGKVGKFSVFIGFVLGFLILVSGVSGATNVSSCQVISSAGVYVLNTSITNGTVTGCINITASDVILDGAGYNINGTGTYGTYGVYVYNSSSALTNVTVKNLNVTNWYYGIEYDNTQNGSIDNNTANSNKNYGIYLVSSSSNTLSNNTALHSWYGIYLKHSSNNYLSKNTVSNWNWYGIYLYFSSSNTINNNTVNSNHLDGIYLNSSSNNNTLSNNNASNNGNGIYLVYSSNNYITNNAANSNNHGIYLSSSSNNNTLSSNTANSNKYSGIFLLYSSNNHITNNTANLNNYDGIVISSSSNNVLTQNTMSNNTYNFYIDGFSISNFVQTIDTSNTVNGKPIYYLVGASNQMINSSTNAGYVGVVNSINVTVSDLTLTNNGQGVLFVNTSNSSVLNVNASNNHYGIYLYFSSINTLSNNTASNNIVGIDLGSSSNNTLTNNTASNNRKNKYGYGGYGIYLYSSSNNTLTSNNALHNRFGIYLNSSSNYNTIASNTANSNEYYGIRLAYSSNYNTVSNNRGGIWLSSSSNNTIASNIASNKDYGIQLDSSSNNTITSNTASNNTFYGIWLTSSSNNTITNNTASNNQRGIMLHHSSNNTLTNNILNSNNYDGISLAYSSNNTLTNNILNSNNYDGIYIQNSNKYNIISGGTINNNGRYGIFIAGTINHGSSYITVTGVQIHNNGPLSSTGAGIYDLVEKGESYQNFSYNNISGSYYGIYLIGEDNSNITGNMVWNNTYGISLQSSSYNTLIRNIMSNNTYNFDINGSSISNFVQTIDTSNTVNGKPIYYLVGASNQMINSSTNAGYVGVVNSINVTVSNLTLTNNGEGVLFVNTSSSSVFNVNASNNKVGIPLKYSSNNTFKNNTLAGNGWDFNSQNSSSNTIINNLFNNTKASFTYLGDIKVNSSTSPAGSPIGYTSIGKYLNITNMSAAAWVYLNVSYNNSDAARLTESTLKMWDYNGTGWNQISGINGVNAAQNYVYANLTSFSVFAPMGNDITLPSVNLISPTNSTYNTTQIPLNYASSDANLQTTWYQYNGTNTTLTGNTTFTALDNNESVLILWANDTVGNINSTSVTFTVDTTPPEVSIISPLNTTYNTSSVILNLSRSDNVGVNTTLYSVDGAVNLTYSAPTTVTGLANGTHNIVVFTNDSAGNVNITSVSFSVDIINESVNNIVANASNNQANVSIPDVFINISTVLALVGKVNVTVYSATPPSVNTSLSVARYVEINVSDNMNDTSGNLSWVYLSVNYTSQEVSGLDESTLRLYWWNPIADNWTKLVTGANLTAYGGPYVYGAGVNTVANYVWANLSHFSTYGISGSVPSPTPSISPVSYGGTYTPEVTLLGNSIDLSLAGELVNYLKAQGITVHITNAQNFSEYSKWQYIIILGGPEAYESVGNIVANITGSKDKAEILNGSAYMKKGSVFRSGGVVYLFAGKDRNATEKAWEEHYKEVAKEIEYNWG